MNMAKKRSGERGTQIVELAVVLPLLVFLALIVSEGAAFVRVHQLLNNAARESARLSVENKLAGSQVATQKLQFLQDTATCYLIRNGVTPPAGQVPASCTTTATSTKCGTYSVTVNQGIVVPTPSGTNMSASLVTVTCGYQVKYLPKFPWFGVSGVFSTGRVNLVGSAEFRNFY